MNRNTNARTSARSPGVRVSGSLSSSPLARDEWRSQQATSSSGERARYHTFVIGQQSDSKRERKAQQDRADKPCQYLSFHKLLP